MMLNKHVWKLVGNLPSSFGRIQQGRRPFFFAALGLHTCAQAFSSYVSVVVAHGLRCSIAWGLFPDQEWNLCPLHWQADS